MIKIGFVTGARSEYGVMKRLIREVVADPLFDVKIVATGMHYQHKYGDTINEIRKDDLAPVIDAPCYVEEERAKEKDFVQLIDTLYGVLAKNPFDVVYIIGDRLEAYAAALAAHFLKIPVAHFAGGQLTNGAVDNIYRYNISNIATLHFVTNTFAKDRLLQCPIVDGSKVFLVGSSAIDSIKEYLNNPKEAQNIDERLARGNYALMTFHSETKGVSANNTIPEVMDAAIESIVKRGVKLLLTYPNNDDGSDAIIAIIKKWEIHPLVVVKKNLGSEYYYTAVDNALFVIGNSSSGIIEIPYFQKYTINIGERQAGRNAPASVISVPDDCEAVVKATNKVLDNPVCDLPQEYIYGKGDSIRQIHDILTKEIVSR